MNVNPYLWFLLIPVLMMLAGAFGVSLMKQTAKVIGVIVFALFAIIIIPTAVYLLMP